MAASAIVKKFAPMFISHGAPTLIIDTKHPTHSYLKKLGEKVGKPKAIVIVSAHWESAPVEVTSSTKLIYDFYGFPDEMYQYKWAAPEDPKLARRLVDMLNKANIETHFNEKRGIDHGSWVPLALMYPDADVPVVQVALHRQLSIKHHIEIGKALRPLIDDGILIIGSGGSTHNLRKLNWENFYGSSDKWVDNWETSLKEVIELEDLEEREKKLAGIVHHDLFRTAHPREEHFMPIAVTVGAGGKAKRIHTFSGGNFAVSQFEFEVPRPPTSE